MEIIRVINNNNVCVLNEWGKEQIVSGKGIGFSKKPGDTVEVSQIQKTYLVTDSKMQEELISLLSEIPEGYIKLTNDLVEHIKSVLKQKLNESLLITLSDHIYFAIKRKRKGIEFTNPMIESLRMCYPEELRLGYYCLEQIESRLKVKFIPDEAGFIAMHIINARLETGINHVYETAKLISACSEMVLYRFPHISTGSTSYERFMVHVKFMINRVYEEKPFANILSDDADFYESIRTIYTKEAACAEAIAQYILESKHIQLPEDELITLTMHVAKMARENRSKP